MSDELASPPSEERSALPPKLFFLCFQRYKVLFWSLLFIGSIGALIFLCPASWFAANSNTQDIATLKSQVTALNSRVGELEKAKEVLPTPLVDPKEIKDMETRITILHQQIEVLQNQPKVDSSPQLSEQSLTLGKAVDRLMEAQKALKSVILFWRLKAKILSEEPYAAELEDFKEVTSESDELMILEEYASRGLQVLKETPKNILSGSSENEEASWWDYLKAMAGSFIKIEKVDEPLSLPLSSSTDRQAIEEALETLDQALTKQVAKISFTMPSLLGEPA
jgi:hypothetical protein